MAITKLTTAQIKNIVNEAYKQFTGTDDVQTQIDLSTFADTGVADVSALRSQFTGKLLNVIAKNWFTDSSYRSAYRDVFFEDTARFGNIIQMISAKVPEVKDNSAWQTFTNGTSTVGTYTVYMPVVDSLYMVKQEAWALPITITGEQWNTAFHSETELMSFVDYLFMLVDNAIVQHLEDLNALNRNNFIAEKLNATDTSVAGVHSVDLVASYVADRGITESLSVETFLSTKDCLVYCIEQIKLYMSYMQKQTTVFNTAGKVRFTPKDRLVVQLLSYFEERLFAVAQSSTFHNDLISLPYHESIPAWQSMSDFSFSGVSSINVKTSNGHEIEKAGIVGFIADKWAIIHTMVSNRIGVHRADIEDVTLYEYQYVDKFINNLSMPGIVFVLNDYTA